MGLINFPLTICCSLLTNFALFRTCSFQVQRSISAKSCVNHLDSLHRRFKRFSLKFASFNSGAGTAFCGLGRRGLHCTKRCLHLDSSWRTTCPTQLHFIRAILTVTSSTRVLLLISTFSTWPLRLLTSFVQWVFELL